MRDKNFLIFGSIVIGLFIFGIIQLLLLRFSAGDVYPYYSSLRADPLGTKALYESVEICCGLQVQRNYEPFSSIKNEFKSSIFVLGLEHRTLEAVPKSIGDEINYFISNGGRLVITLHRSPDPQSIGALEEGESFIDITEIWGVRLFLEKQATTSAYLDASIRSSDLPKNISAHTPLYFQTVSPGWRTIYKRDEHPVLIERNLGRGSIVLSTESFFLSNEAIAIERNASLIVWLIGSAPSVIFDEYHHGVAAQAGVMYLVRKYHLEWAFLTFLLLALLFIWKNAAPFVPPDHDTAEALQSGKESMAGLTNLLRRNVPVPQLLSVCYSEWQKSAKNIADEKKKGMEKILSNEMAKPARQRNLPAVYNALSRTLKERR